jgi:ABC-type multidrug transport system ATPase subunit
VSAAPRFNGEPAVELRDVTIRTSGRVLLDRVSLNVPDGRALGILGTNGSGKSALLRTIAGLTRPSAGQVHVGGHDVVESPHLTRPLIGYVSDEPGLAERLTPGEHLDLVAAQHSLSRADRRAAAESMLELVDLAGYARRMVDSLSRGQRRRLALALALVHDPAIILLDQPLDGIDEIGREEFISVLMELRSMEKTLLIASESRADVADVCDATTLLVDGRVDAPVESAAVIYTWIEIVGDPDLAIRALLQRPGIDDVRQDGSFITVRGPTSGEERAIFAEWLLGNGVHLAGFGATNAPAGGSRQ